MVWVLPVLSSWLACGEGRALPAAEGPVLLARAGVPLLTVRVSEDVLGVGDPRYLPREKGLGRYAGSNDPWRWTDAQRTLAAAMDLRELLTTSLCGEEVQEHCAVGLEAWKDPRDDASSILVGRPADFGYRGALQPPGEYDREQHRVRTAGDRVLLLGAEGAGVELAVWDFAERLGYRYLLPTPTWEIVPDFVGKDLMVPLLDELQGPAASLAPGFVTRTLTGPLVKGPGYDHQAWMTRNGFAGSVQRKGVQGQWGKMVQKDLAWYGSHPDALSSSSRALLSQRPAVAKLCPGERELAARIYQQWASPRLADHDPQHFDNDLTRDLLPLSPGDSTYWARCPPSEDRGPTPADRSLALVSDLARQARQQGTLGEREIGLLAYREVFPGPLSARADPSVFVWLVGNGYMGTPFDEALSAWRDAGVRHLGLYLYWNADPGELPLESGPQAPVSTAALLARRQQQGLQSLWVEASGGWGANGLFRWALLHIARDPSLAGTDPHAAVDRWLAMAVDTFPVGAQPGVRSFLSSLDASDKRLLLSPDLLADLYGALGQAREACLAVHDPESQARVEDLLVYVRHLELYWRWREGQGGYDAFVEHAACTAPRRMVDMGVLWASTDPTAVAARTAYKESHQGLDPREAVLGRCPVPDYEGWIAHAPARQQTIPPYQGEPPQAYARPTAWPGTARAGGTFEDALQGLPRDSLLWTALVDPSVGLRVQGACYGTLGNAGKDPSRQHTTSRLLGAARLQLVVSGTEQIACEVSFPPTQEGWDVAFSPSGARISPGEGVGSGCLSAPRALPLDTGTLPATPLGSCTPSLFARAGVAALYEVRTVNHRMGFDYASIEGALGLVRWDSPVGPDEERRPQMGRTWRYFYVPAGKEAVTLWNSGGPCRVLRDQLASHAVDLATGVPEYHVVSATTPDGLRHDGEIWALSACREAYLVDVPPVVSPKKELLLVPCDKVGEPGWAPLMLDASTCGR